MQGQVHSMESFGSADGPGVRYLVFLKDCHLRCRYCHNPDTWANQECTQMTAEDILDKAEHYRSYWGSKGGITVSGGEPLLQIDFLLELFQKAKERKIHTCIDTAGEPFTKEEPWFSKFQELLKYTDLLMVDIKHIDPTKHKNLVGKSNENILEMFHYLNEVKQPIWIRYVLVPGYSDEEEDLKKTVDFISTLENVERVDVLPYHNLGVQKWKKLGIPYSLEGVEPPSKEFTKNVQELFNKALEKKKEGEA